MSEEFIMLEPPQEQQGQMLCFSQFQNPLSWTEDYDPDVMAFAE